MLTLFDEEFAPITSAGGFINASLGEVADAFEQWHNTLYGPGVRQQIDGDLTRLFRRLQPLRMGSTPRIALLGMGEWTAYFDCGLRGTDPVGAMSVLAQRLLRQAVALTSRPHTLDKSGLHKGRMGAVKFTMYGPLKTEWINDVRSVGVIFDGNRWVFGQAGTPQAFEEPERYTERLVRNRFTSEMLERYCAALGFHPFDRSAYNGDGIFMESPIPEGPKPMITKTLPEAQAWLGIVPGAALSLPG